LLVTLLVAVFFSVTGDAAFSSMVVTASRL
jgi:hypothetical protein